MRLDAYVARFGIQTRNGAKKMIRNGHVTINQTIVKDPSTIVHVEVDLIAVNNEKILYKPTFTVMMNKRAGVVSARKDSYHPTVFDDINPNHRYESLKIAGRLDKDTEGLIILSTDGDLIHQLTHPKKDVLKTYLVVCDQPIDSVDPLLEPLMLLDGKKETYTPAKPVIISHQKDTVVLAISEGKFHQVKRMFQAIGHTVIFLKRLAIHTLTLDPNLKPGAYRELTSSEIDLLIKK